MGFMLLKKGGTWLSEWKFSAWKWGDRRCMLFLGSILDAEGTSDLHIGLSPAGKSTRKLI